MQHLSVTTERKCFQYRNDCAIACAFPVLHRRLLNSSTLGRRLCQFLRIALNVYNYSLCQHHCTAVSPSFSCFSPAQFTKKSPVGRCQTQLRTLPLISPRPCNIVLGTTEILLIMHISYYIDDFLVFSFFFLTEFL